MNILPYTEAHNRFRERVRNFLKEEVEPCVDEWEKKKSLPRSFWKSMGAQGFICTNISTEYGGLGGDFLYSVIVAEELTLSRQCGVGMGAHSDIVVPYIDSFGSEKIKKKYLPGCVSGDLIASIAMSEPGVGSNLAGIATTAVEDGNEIVINGSKTFITNGVNGDLAVLAAVDPDAENAYKGMSLYVVEADSPGYKKGKQLDKMGMYTSDTGELFFTDCRIPKENRLGEKGRGFYMLMEKLQQERIITALWSMRPVETIIRQTMDYYKENSGEGKKYPESQARRFKLVDMLTEVTIGRTFLDQLILNHMAGNDVVTETSMAKYWITDTASRIAEQCLDIFEEDGLYESCPIVRPWRDLRAMEIFAGTNEIMKTIIAGKVGL